MRIQAAQQYNLQSYSSLINKQNNNSLSSFRATNKEKETQRPDCYGMDIVNKPSIAKKKKGVPYSLVVNKDTGRTAVINFDEKFIFSLLLIGFKAIINIEDYSKSPLSLLHHELFLEKPVLKKLPKDARLFLDKLKSQQPEKHQLVNSVLQQTSLRTRTQEGVSDEYITNFVKKLAECHSVLLKNVVDNEIPIRIYDCADYSNGDFYAAEYVQKYVAQSFPPVVKNKYINLMERDYDRPFIDVIGAVYSTVDAIPHELSHAFDCNYVRKSNLIGQNNSYKACSSSKEFDAAFNEDIVHMSNMEQEAGLPKGTMLESLFKNAGYLITSEKSLQRINAKSLSELIDKPELFAQLLESVARNTLDDKKLDLIVKTNFPNSLAFCKKLLEEAESL